MTLDGITLKVIVDELNSTLLNAKIEKIYEPTHDEITLNVHSASGRKKLILNSSASECRICISEVSKKNPEKAANFCMVLRKYLTSGRIVEISQIGLDRIVDIKVDSKDELSVNQFYHLIIEMMGKYSNIILANNDYVVLDSIKHVSIDTSSKRQILPGIRYVLPPRDKISIFECDRDTTAPLLKEELLPNILTEIFEGFSPQISNEIFYRYKTENGDKLNIFDFAYSYIRKITENSRPCLQFNMDNNPVFFSLVPFNGYSEENRKYYDSANQMIDAFFTTRYINAEIKNERDSYLRIVRKNIVKIEKRLKIHLSTINDKSKIDKYLLYGELISANIYQIKRGSSKVNLLNYYDNTNIDIAMDPAISPAQNATKYFKKASKLKNGVVMAQSYYEKDKAEVEYLYETEFDLNKASTLDDLHEIKSELVRFGYIEINDKKKKSKEEYREIEPIKATTVNGFTLLIGKNSRQNDFITMRVADKEDYWFHAKNVPGSHVILLSNGKKVPDEDIVEAATYAAKYSKTKADAKMAIDYTQRKNVWKANGAKPGMVLYDKYNTILISPD